MTTCDNWVGISFTKPSRRHYTKSKYCWSYRKPQAFSQ